MSAVRLTAAQRRALAVLSLVGTRGCVAAFCSDVQQRWVQRVAAAALVRLGLAEERVVPRWASLDRAQGITRRVVLTPAGRAVLEGAS